MSRLLRISDVAEMLCQARNQDVKEFLMYDATFPRPLRTMNNQNFWEERDIREWAANNDIAIDDKYDDGEDEDDDNEDDEG